MGGVESRGGGFFLVRHGETTANRARVRSGGECDARLTARGRRQAAEVGRVLAAGERRPGLVVAGCLGRTRATASIVNEVLGGGLEVRFEAGLNERLLGDWNGRGVAETEAALVAGETPPGGESNAVFRARVLEAFAGVVPLGRRWPVVVSSRGIARILAEQAGWREVPVIPTAGLMRATLGEGEGVVIERLEMVGEWG